MTARMREMHNRQRIDLEGAEWPVLQGMPTLLRQPSTMTEILIGVEPESLREHGTTTEEFISVLRATGFRPIA
jgi:hypothetical protein